MTERNTRQKETVRLVFRKRRTHPTAESVVSAVQSTDPTIGRATVYRVLASMAKHGEILKVHVADGADRFDFNNSPHSHIKCESCGAVDDVITAEPDDSIPTILDCRGYVVLKKTVLYYGLCPDCSAKEKQQ